MLGQRSAQIMLLLLALGHFFSNGIFFPKVGCSFSSSLHSSIKLKPFDSLPFINQTKALSRIEYRKLSQEEESPWIARSSQDVQSNYIFQFLPTIFQAILKYTNKLYCLTTNEINSTVNNYYQMISRRQEQSADSQQGLIPSSSSSSFSFFSFNISQLIQSYLIDQSVSPSYDDNAYKDEETNSNQHQTEAERYQRIIEAAKITVSKYLELNAMEYWDYYGHEEDIMVWRLKKSIKGVGSLQARWPCIKSFTTIDLSTESLFQLLYDSKKVAEYNKYSIGRIDIETFSKFTKIVWNRSKFSFAKHDFCSLMHAYSPFPVSAAGSHHPCILILSTAVKHQKVPVNKEYARSEILFSLNILSPNRLNSSKTDFTTISHVKYAGIHPVLVWKSGSQGTIQYLKNLKDMARHYRS